MAGECDFHFISNHFPTYSGVVMVVIVWWLDLQLLVQSVPITTNFTGSNPVHGKMYSIQHYVIKFVSYYLQRYNWNIVKSGVKDH